MTDHDPSLSPERPASEQEPQQWRPIETAPKDGTHVLLYMAVKTGTVNGAQTTRDRIEVGRFDRNIKEIPEGRWYGGYWMMTPTHWMPLPNPPQPVAERPETQRVIDGLIQAAEVLERGQIRWTLGIARRMREAADLLASLLVQQKRTKP